MRLLLLAPHPYYVDRGTPIAVDTMLRALSDRGASVDALVYPDGQDRSYESVVIHRVRAPRSLRHIGPGFSFKKVLCDVFMLLHARRLARANKYDVVHAGEEAVFIAMVLKLVYGIPYVYDMDSSIAQQMIEKMPWLKPLAWLFNWCEARAIRGAAAVAPVCNALADVAKRAGAKHVAPMHDISQLDEPDRAPTGDLRKRLSIDGPIVLYVGNFEPYQGLDLLLESFARAIQKGSHASLVLAGGSETHIAHYKRKADSLGLNDRAHFIGPWPAARLEELLVEADILTSPRIQGINTPMKIFPYMHTGKPLLATDLTTHNQILTQKVAMLAPPEPEAYAEAMLELSENEPLRERIGLAGRTFVECNHTGPAHQHRVDGLYNYIEKMITKTNSMQKVGA